MLSGATLRYNEFYVQVFHGDVPHKNQTLLPRTFAPMKRFLNDFPTLILASLTLGLAPFVPEPHILGKLRWVAGGAVGMQPMDWFELALHGLPWVLLLRLAVLRGVQAVRKAAQPAKV